MSKQHRLFKKIDARGKTPESWACVDCGVNTAPGMSNRAQIEQALANDWNNQGCEQTIDDRSEVYLVKPAIWEAAGMGKDEELWAAHKRMSGCLCIGCLEKRLGRILTPRDFLRNRPLNSVPGTKRLLSRRNHQDWQPTTVIKDIEQ